MSHPYFQEDESQNARRRVEGKRCDSITYYYPFPWSDLEIDLRCALKAGHHGKHRVTGEVRGMGKVTCEWVQRKRTDPMSEPEVTVLK